MATGLNTLIGKHILVVEDELAIALMLETVLEDCGCVVALAPSVEKALASILTHAPDGVLLDMNLRGQTTIPVAEELADRAVPFLLVTGYGAGDADPPVIKAAPRVQKPFDLDDLTRRMAEVFGRPAADAPG